MKKKIKVFVSYAKRNKAAKEQFMAMLRDYAGADVQLSQLSLDNNIRCSNE